MIAGYFHQGSGLGNQLHRYVATRVRASDLGVDFGMIYNPDGSGKVEKFKGQGFMDIDWGKPVERNVFQNWQEKKVIENGIDIRSYDPEFNFVPDNTVIDGEFQDERYWAQHEQDVRNWLEVEYLDIPYDTCVIGFRGGEYALFPDLFLLQEYWSKAIEMMKRRGIRKFEVHTDDIITAKQFFPDYKVIHDIGTNWRAMRYAKNAIIANSSFYILPRWLRQGEGGAFTIAPRYWSRHNIGIWALPQNYYSRFKYI